MAGDRHGKHNTTTISFRVNSYEKATIEERVKVSGMKKQDYIVRSCIYNHVCVVGKKETIEIIRSEMKEMSLVLEDVADNASQYIKIPMQGQVESLNAAIAASILMFEAGRQGHIVYLGHVPGVHQYAARIGVIAYQVHSLGNLVNMSSLVIVPCPPLVAIYRSELAALCPSHCSTCVAQDIRGMMT